MAGNGYFRKFVPLARQRCVEVAAPYKYASISHHKICIVNNIRPYCIRFICCFEQNKTNPSVYASRIRLPYREAKIDSATNPNLSICSMYARRYINGLFSMISFSEKIFRRRAVKSQIGAFYILHALCKQPKIKKQ